MDNATSSRETDRDLSHLLSLLAEFKDEDLSPFDQGLVVQVIEVVRQRWDDRFPHNATKTGDES